MASSAGADKADLGPQAAATSKLSPTLPLENSEAPKSSLKTAVPPTEDQEETEGQNGSSKISEKDPESPAKEVLPASKGLSRPQPLVIDSNGLEPQEKSNRRTSKDGSVIIHSNASDSPLEISEGMQKLLIPSPHKKTDKGSNLQEGKKPSQAAPLPESNGDLSEDFEELDIEPDAATAVNGQAEASPQKSEHSRTGVTVTPPFTPKVGTQGSDKPQPGLGSAPSQGGSNVAEELAEAEARADEAALAASQRGNSLGKQLSREGQESAEEKEPAPFTEEALHSGGDNAREDAASEAAAAPAPRRLEVSEADVQSYEPPEYRGLVYHDGVDSIGRPVVVVNADALAPGASRKDAISYMQQRLEPIVVQGPYVLIFLNSGPSMQSKVSPGWLAACYRQMSYPFRKNVKFVILVRPSAGLRFMLAIMRPLVSPKAFKKVKKVPNLAAMSAATNNEVTLQHLGPRFATSAGKGIVEGEMGSAGTGSKFQMPNLSDLEMSQRR